MTSKKSISGEDLRAGSFYPWTPAGYAGEPITRLLPVSNTRGIRVATRSDKSIALIVLYDTSEQSQWPNKYDEDTKILTYFGDNRDLDKPFDSKPGNVRLQEAFGIFHDQLLDRTHIPLFLYFKKSTVQSGVTFVGQFVPGSSNLLPGADLFVVQNPSNICAKFTKLDAGTVSREFLDAFIASPTTNFAPSAYRNWVEEE
jgi:hypothetical protein